MGGGKQRPDKKSMSLAEQLHSDQFVTRQRSRQNRAGEDENETARMEPRAARRIVAASRKHLQDDSGSDRAADSDDDNMPAPSKVPGPEQYDNHEADAAAHADDDDNEDDDDVEIEYDDHESVATEVEMLDDLGEAYGISEEDAAAFDKFMPESNVRSRNLADIIMSKIHEKEARAAGEYVPEENGDEQFDQGPPIDARVKRVYNSIGNIMKRYTSGKVPKAFKILPHVQNWEQLMFLTRPQDWSPHACYVATRIFASGANEKMAQRFYNAILLPIVHDAMAEESRLHPALFQALRKALFKPVAFYKGFLLPLCQEGSCTLREALAVGAILQKMHLPPVPTAVVIVKISLFNYTPANGLFLRVLMDKKMSLPFQAVDAMVKYFHRFIASHPNVQSDPLPVLWHQTFLSFVQNYKLDLTPEQLELLRQVCTKHFHRMITPEVRREIAVAQGKASSME